MNTKKWTTKSGEKIRVKDMTDSHLVNTIHFIERYKGKVEMSMMRFADSMVADMASFISEQNYEAFAEQDTGEAFPIYQDMIEEAYKRGLEY